jgi:hypothetical protein
VDAPGPVVDTLIELGGPSAVYFEVLGERTVAPAQLEKRRDLQMPMRCKPRRSLEFRGFA